MVTISANCLEKPIISASLALEELLVLVPNEYFEELALDDLLHQLSVLRDNLRFGFDDDLPF